MKNDENKERLPHERKMPFDGIQLAYALFIVMYFRAAPHCSITVFVIVHNHKHEQNKITRWACYIGAIGVLYIFVDYYLFK